MFGFSINILSNGVQTYFTNILDSSTGIYYLSHKLGHV